MAGSQYSYSYMVKPDKKARPPIQHEVEIGPRERVILAKELSLDGIQAANASFEIRPWRGNGWRVSGLVRAEIDQTCVISLEPMVVEVEETFDRTFVPASGPENPMREIEIDPSADDPAEPFFDGKIDLGAIACEHLALGIDPYPRKPGKAFADGDDGTPTNDEDDTPSPFSALRSLAEDQ